MAKMTDHNGKEIREDSGKNIRVTTDGWKKIRRHCFDHSLVMGSFVENAALEKISQKIKSSKK
jgi:hypothetical protein